MQRSNIFILPAHGMILQFSHDIFERTKSAYSRVGHVNYGQLGNRVANLWIDSPLGLGYRAGARLTYPARHTPLSPTLSSFYRFSPHNLF